MYLFPNILFIFKFFHFIRSQAMELIDVARRRIGFLILDSSLPGLVHDYNLPRPFTQSQQHQAVESFSIVILQMVANISR